MPRAVAESDVEIFVIITPPDSRAELVRLALEYGKHVVVEKPLASTRAEAEVLADLASDPGLYLLVAPCATRSKLSLLLGPHPRRSNWSSPLRAGALRERRLAHYLALSE